MLGTEIVRAFCTDRPRKAMPTDAYMAIEFAQSKGQARQEGKTGVKFNDVAGMGQTLQELQEIVEVSILMSATLHMWALSHRKRLAV